MTPYLFLDLDGCLVDFVGGMCAAHERPNPYDNGHTDYGIEHAWDMDATTFWAPTHDPDFWSSLAWTAEGRDILRLCVDAVGEANVYLLTSGRGAGAAAGKVAWVERELGRPWLDRFLLGHCKYLCAGPGRILVDDFDGNCKTFRAHGGYAVLVPRPWNESRGGSNAVAWVDVGIRNYLKAMR